MNIKEADIKGIDELVYNPATKKGGSIGYGYDNGQRKEGITWSNHDNHLHIGFTDRNTAINVIDKASSMGLSTTENPYSKNDPNKKIGKHTGGSLHYKNFPGTPLVGMAVDITGNPTKITELIKWINKTYAGQYTPTTDTTDTDTDSSEGGYLSSWAGNVAKTIMPVGTSIDVRSLAGLKEDIDRIKSLL